MYGVIAEDASDVETLQMLVRRLSNYATMPIKGKGYGGCGEMLRKGASQLRMFAELGCKRFIICYDADGPSPEEHRQEVINKIVRPSKLSGTSCLSLVPVQEIEAWILADIHQAVPKVIPSWRPAEVSKPESIASPKEHLENLSRGSNKKPRYAYTIHNARVAKHLDFQTLHKKCPSFRPLCTFVIDRRKIKLPSQPFPAAGTRRLWAYTDPNGGSQYACQLASAQEWGEVTTYVQGLDEQPEELTRLCEYGWANLKVLENEVLAILGTSRPKARLRTALTVLKQLAADHQEASYIGLDDGTR